ncbi:MAG: protein kinase [Leifsonia sp.]
MRRAPSTPPELPGYAFEDLLGSGGFSDVFLYEQRLPRRRVAVKVLLTDQLDRAVRAQFVAEANLMAQLSAHPYIVTIFHADVAGDGRPYFVMEYCSGPSLADRYKRAPFSVEDALRTGVRLAGAIATAHAAGILHRDIKPANVLTNDYGWPALTDFGISSTLEDELPVHTTTLPPRGADAETGSGQSAVGLSVPWSPPEMFGDDPQPDVRSDVFSLAATIHTLLAARTPFEVPGRSNGTLDLIGRIERGTITPIGRDDVPSSLVAVLEKGMASRPEDRYASATDFARSLQRVELELGYAATTIEVPSIARRPAARAANDADSDETAVRSVTTIEAQAPARTAAPSEDATRARGPVVVDPSPRRSVPDDGTVIRQEQDESTVIRPRPRAEATGAATPAAVPPPGTGARRRRGLAIGIGAATAVLVAGAIIAAVLVAPSTAPGVGQTAKPGSDVSAIVGGAVPSPAFVSAVPSADGTAVTFTFENPDAEKGDVYRWALTDTPDQVNRSTDPVITVTGVVPGDRICLDVRLQRTDGAVSEAGRGCTA